jgi:MFS family permease
MKIFTRDFVINFFAQFVSSFVFCILIPTFPIFLSRLGSKEAEIGVLVGALSVASLIIRPFVGRALFKISEKKFMIAGNFLCVVSSIAYLIAPPFWPLLAVRVVQGIGVAFFSTASFTLLANITPETNRGQILSYFYLSINVAFALAPYFGILLINYYDFNVLFLFCTGLSLCGLLVTLKLGEREIEPSSHPSIKNQAFLSHEALPASIMSFMVNIIWGALTAFFPLYALSHGVTNPGLFFAAFAIMLILGRAFGGKILDIYSREKIMFPCLIAYIVAMFILAFSTTHPMFILAAVIWGIGNAFLYPILVLYAIDRAGPARGPAIATFTAIGDLGAGLGSLIMGIILQLSSYRLMFLCLAITGTLNFLYFYFFVRKKGGDGHAYL